MSTRITKEIASEVAKKLLQSLDDRVKLAETKLLDFCIEKYMETIPEEVKSIFNDPKLKKFIQVNNYINFVYSGQYFAIRVKSYVPQGWDSYNCVLKPSDGLKIR